MTPTARTLQFLRGIGFDADVVERRKWKITVDVFGFGDILAHRPGVGIILVQTTSGDHHAERRAKILAEPRAAGWLASGGRIEIVSWAKQGARGKRKTWQVRREEITGEMMRATT